MLTHLSSNSEFYVHSLKFTLSIIRLPIEGWSVNIQYMYLSQTKIPMYRMFVRSRITCLIAGEQTSNYTLFSEK